MPRPLQVDLLTLKVESESRVTLGYLCANFSLQDSKMADRSDVFALYLLLSQFCWELCFGLLLIFV